MRDCWSEVDSLLERFQETCACFLDKVEDSTLLEESGLLKGTLVKRYDPEHLASAARELSERARDYRIGVVHGTIGQSEVNQLQMDMWEMADLSMKLAGLLTTEAKRVLTRYHSGSEDDIRDMRNANRFLLKAAAQAELAAQLRSERQIPGLKASVSSR